MFKKLTDYFYAKVRESNDPSFDGANTIMFGLEE